MEMKVLRLGIEDVFLNVVSGAKEDEVKEMLHSLIPIF